MAGSSFIAAIHTAAAHPYGLVVGGLDVIKEAGSPGNLFGVPIDSIVVTEAGPGAVSAMSFTIDDPTIEVRIGEGTAVAYWDLVNNVCLFRGWVDNFYSAPDFGGQGRKIEVQCTGVETLLDWIIVPNSFSLTGQYSLPNVTGLLAQGFAPQLRAPSIQPGMSLAPYTRAGSFDYPIGNFVRPFEPSNALQYPVGSTWTAPGGTLRNAITDFAAHCSWFDVSASFYRGESVRGLWTVDFYFGLRAWEDSTSVQPDDYTTLTVVDTIAGSIRAEDLRVRVDWANVARSAIVQGSGGVVYGPFSDGSGVQGRQILINDTTVTTEDIARVRALGALGEVAANTRGTFTIGDFTPTTTVHAGSLVSITDAATGLATTHRIMEIRKTFNPSGRQNWTVTFGGLSAPSVARLIRRLTRDSLN